MEFPFLIVPHQRTGGVRFQRHSVRQIQRTGLIKYRFSYFLLTVTNGLQLFRVGENLYRKLLGVHAGFFDGFKVRTDCVGIRSWLCTKAVVDVQREQAVITS